MRLSELIAQLAEAGMMTDSDLEVKIGFNVAPGIREIKTANGVNLRLEPAEYSVTDFDVTEDRTVCIIIY
jgi:hypothetical protein